MSDEMMMLQWEQWLAAISAVGAFGVAAVGVTDAFSKIFVFTWNRIQIGLPYVGFSHIKTIAKPLDSALRFSYGKEYMRMLAQQYRDGRSKGKGPTTIQQGVRLALPFMDKIAVTALISSFWGANDRVAAQMARVLTERGDEEDEEESRSEERKDEDAIALIGRFSVALDSRIEAAYNVAEQRYISVMQFSAGLTAIALSLVFNLGFKWVDTTGGLIDDVASSWTNTSDGYPWIVAFIIGVAAVPLAPIAKDLSSALSDALKAWREVGGKKA